MTARKTTVVGLLLIVLPFLIRHISLPTYCTHEIEILTRLVGESGKTLLTLWIQLGIASIIGGLLLCVSVIRRYPSVRRMSTHVYVSLASLLGLFLVLGWIASFNCVGCLAGDMPIRSFVHNFSATAELYYEETGGTYAGLCESEYINTLKKIRSGMRDAEHKTFCFLPSDLVVCRSTSEAYVLSVQLYDGGTDDLPAYYCIDSHKKHETLHEPPVGFSCLSD